ncbi:hypothetical protein ACFWP7_30960 [Streptomyces sp. NPDC058470]|uniref:hypothetical protein n=1 Tax=Streptomyces sp. NPDC058470 TaxID=3346515 RepID=UPI00365ECEAF
MSSQPHAVRLSLPAAKVLAARPEQAVQMVWDVLDVEQGDIEAGSATAPARQRSARQGLLVEGPARPGRERRLLPGRGRVPAVGEDQALVLDHLSAPAHRAGG